MLTEVSALKKISDLFGHSIEYSQGGGSNASAKVGGTMLIKASGFTLAEMVKKQGYVAVLYEPIAELYSNGCTVDEDTARATIRKAIIPPGEGTTPNSSRAGSLKPSIETGFHTFLRKYVLHFHPLYLNAILCLKDCAPILRELYSDLIYVLVNYKRPGHFLAAEVARSISSPAVTKRGRDGDQIIFLKNHGLIVSGDNPDVVIKTAQSICDKAKRYVLSRTGLLPYTYNDLPVASLSDNQFLFPDAVVFLRNASANSNPSRNFNEVLFVHNAILELTAKLGEHDALSDRDVQELLEMEEEKYRQSLSTR